MARTRRLLLLSSALLLAACASAPAVDPILNHALAPTGTLRVGVAAGAPAALTRDLGEVLAGEIGVPPQVVAFDRAAQVVDAMKAGQVDFSCLEGGEPRARDVDFAYPLVRLRSGFLAMAIPKGRDPAAVAYLSHLGERLRSDGRLAAMVARAGLRGATTTIH
ncbi:hypothetical protein [Ramlibacter algicola]|uniref:Transporter substrate-binding domain-containing protein n=1 Tax=Ramlibacter algicola TaxID=2795217 RepID=A0A934USW7_9BURK|nr:hypothetical protein [Ramlibacter algicola]MBK0393922.1 hypothetical protein [Ramlibacter algicola]